MSTINIIDVRRVAAARGVSEQRLLKAAEDAGVVLHRINGRAFVQVDDEDRIAERLTASQVNASQQVAGGPSIVRQ